MMMKKTMIASGMAALAFATAAPALGASAHMGGLLGGSPVYRTITGPQGQTCNSGWGGDCKKLSYDNLTVASGKRAIERWVAANGSQGNTIWVYSLSTNAAIAYLNEHPEDKNTWLMFGSPSKPLAPNNAGAANSLTLTNTSANVTFITVYGDSVAMPKAPGASVFKHLAYNNKDYRDPTTTGQAAPNVTDNVYGGPPAPRAVRFNLFDIRTWFRPPVPAAPVTPEPVVEASQVPLVEDVPTPEEEPVDVQDAITATVLSEDRTQSGREADQKAEEVALSEDPTGGQTTEVGTERRPDKRVAAAEERQNRKWGTREAETSQEAPAADRERAGGDPSDSRPMKRDRGDQQAG